MDPIYYIIGLVSLLFFLALAWWAKRIGNYKILATTAFAGGMLLILVLLAFFLSLSKISLELALNLSVIITGIAFGWMIGILVSPYDPKESRQFSAITKGITAFFSGYGLAKIDPIVKRLCDPDFIFRPKISILVLSLVSSIILTMIIVSVYRKYANNHSDDESNSTVTKDGRRR